MVEIIAETLQQSEALSELSETDAPQFYLGVLFCFTSVYSAQ